MIQSYLSRLFASFIGLWNSREDLSFKNVRLSHLHYFLALPLALTFANMQEILFKSDVQLFGFDAKTLIFSAYCLGAGLLFALSSVGNIAVVARVSALLGAAGFVFWVFLPDGPGSVFLAILFMFGMGGSVSCASLAYTFTLNNTERFLGAVMLSFFCALARLNAGAPVLSPFFYRLFLTLLVAGTVLCLSLFKTADFTNLLKRNQVKLNSAIKLTLYFFIAAFCIDYFYSYLPGTAESKAMVLSGLSGLLAVGLAVVMQMAARRSVWHMCNLFFIAMIFSYALFFASDGSFWRDAAIALHGFQLIGYTVMFYLLGCVFKKHGDFRLYKLCLVVIFLAAILTYIIPDALSKYAPELILPLAAITSGALFVVFVLLSPVYARDLFSADWSDDFHRMDMSEAEKKVEQIDRLTNLNLTSREKEVTAFLLHGLSAKQIAGELGISANTANFHIKNLYKKLDINGRAELFSRFGVYTEAVKPKEPRDIQM